MRSLRSLGLITLALAVSGGSCAEERPTTVEEADLPRPDLRLIVLTDLDGYLEPCGCTSRPLGGIDRMAAAVRRLRGEGIPTVFVASGNTFLHGAPHGAELERARAQEIWKAETVVDVLERIELAAATPGPLDFSFGTEAFEELARAADFPLLGANVALGDVFEGQRVIEAGELRVGIVGQTDLRDPAGRLPDRVEERGSLDVPEADVVIALVQGDRRAARRMAAREGIDFVVHGGLDTQDPQPPSSEGEAIVLQAGRHGRGLVVVDLVRRGDGSWTDVSAWTRTERREQLERQIRDLRAQIGEWERDGADEGDVERQRARLGRLEGQSRALLRAPAASGNVFTARFEELPTEAPRDQAIGRLLDRYDRRVNDHNARAFADWAPEPVADGRPHYVGTQACASCHGAAVAWWRTTNHGVAYATLERQHKNFNLSCVGCHVTGYLRPGGSTVTHVENLTNVGCESCHGPASMHIADPERAPVNVVRDPQESTCLGCHNPEHSDTFDFTIYRRMMIAPGHGEPPR